MPAGLEKFASVPFPSANPLLPLPAKVLTFHTQGGSADKPTALQSEGVMQRMAGAGVPPGQKKPRAHGVVEFVGDVDPAAQPKPGAALQAAVQVALVRPVEAP